VFNLFHMFNANELEDNVGWLIDIGVDVEMCLILCEQ
jgi:hypothetical protein